MYDAMGEEQGSRWKVIATVVGLLAVLVVGVVIWQVSSGGGSGESSSGGIVFDSGGPDDSIGSGSASTTESGSLTTSDLGLTALPDPSLRPPETTDDEVAGTAPEVKSPATTTTTATSTSTTTPTTTEPLPPAAEFPTNPDGSPLPLVVIFDTDTITLAGQVPSKAAAERLAVLAVANSQFPDAELIDNMVINPAVPITVGVRVVELNSARFPEASAEILPAHALELDRVVNIMNALPNVSVLVIGHADQRGDDDANFAISDERARAVVNYLRYLGIPPTRLASRAAGASDLITLDNDDAAFALNRRTEFVFNGLLVE